MWARSSCRRFDARGQCVNAERSSALTAVRSGTNVCLGFEVRGEARPVQQNRLRASEDGIGLSFFYDIGRKRHEANLGQLRDWAAVADAQS